MALGQGIEFITDLAELDATAKPGTARTGLGGSAGVLLWSSVMVCNKLVRLPAEKRVPKEVEVRDAFLPSLRRLKLPGGPQTQRPGTGGKHGCAHL